MKDQTGQEIVVGQTVAISVETGLRIGEVIDVNPGAVQLKVDSMSRPGKKANIWYGRARRARIIVQPVQKLVDVVAPVVAGTNVELPK